MFVACSLQKKRMLIPVCYNSAHLCFVADRAYRDLGDPKSLPLSNSGNPEFPQTRSKTPPDRHYDRGILCDKTLVTEKTAKSLCSPSGSVVF